MGAYPSIDAVSYPRQAPVQRTLLTSWCADVGRSRYLGSSLAGHPKVPPCSIRLSGGAPHPPLRATRGLLVGGSNNFSRSCGLSCKRTQEGNGADEE